MLKEPVALVTGASSGIGRAIAQKLSKQGLRVFGTSRDAGRVEAIPGVELLSLDVDSDESVKACVELVLTRAGRLDLAVDILKVVAHCFGRNDKLCGNLTIRKTSCDQT